MERIKISLLVCMAALCTSSAWAQYTINMEQVPLSNYRSVTYDFSLTEICAALDVDTADFANDFYDFTSYPDFVTLETDDHSTNYTQGSGGRGYWMSPDGKAVTWGTDECTFCVLPYPDTENDHLTFAFWQMPDVAQVGDKYHCNIAINYNDKQLTFDINVTVIEKEDLGLETELSKLNILGTIETTTTQEPRSSYAADQVSMDISEAISALGFDAATLKANFSDYLYMAVVDTENDAKQANLSNSWTANSGFWTSLFYDESVGEETGELINGYDASHWKVYIEAFNLNAETGILTANVGQNPNQVGNDVSWWIPMYLINGGNAYELRVNFKTTEAGPDEETLDFDKQTKGGEEDVLVEMWPNTNYVPFGVSFDIDSIAQLIGEDASDLVLRAESAEGEISTNTTASNGGYWLDKDGFVIAWGSGAYIYVEPSSGLTTLYFGQYPGTASIGDVRTLRLYFVGKQSHYQLNVTVNIIEKPTYDLSTYELAADEMYEFQIVPDGEWANEHDTEGIQLGADHLKELLGEGSYTFLGEEERDDGTTLISDSYTCDPQPAFWMKGSYVHAYDGQNSYAILYSASEAKFHFIKQPNFNQVGDNYVGNFWLVNPDTKKYIHYEIYVEYVDEVVNHEFVGSEEEALPLYSEDGGDYAETPVDMTACYNALGCDEDEFRENVTWKIRLASGRFTTDGYEDEMYGFWFDADGNPTTDEDSKAYSVEFLSAVGSDCGEDCFRTYAFTDGVYTPTLCAEYNGKRYVFNLTISSNPTGINEIATGKTADEGRTIYDLAGRKVSRPTKGIYIVNGKKVLVK